MCRDGWIINSADQHGAVKGNLFIEADITFLLILGVKGSLSFYIGWDKKIDHKMI